MLAYAIKRFLGAWPTLFVIITVAFFMMRAVPGGPFSSEKPVPPAVRANLERMYHLDEPLYMQYARYLGDVFTGNLGPSFKYEDHTVNDLIASGFPVSARLGGLAMALALLLGVAAGATAALRQNAWLDHAVMALAMTGISIPNFVMGPLLILVFAILLHWLPAGGWDNGATVNMVLPVISLALPYVAYIARLTRGSMIEVLRSDYIRTARAKGLPARTVILRHALRPAMLPVISFLGPAIAGILTGSVVIEEIFGIPGIGRYFVQGALNRDYTLVMGVVIFYGALIILLNLLVDLLYAMLDPRVRYT
ncbi:MAG: oligopeptide ABC transporter permease OppB [Gammaproteobacteria bacterium]|jgi:oligopeptide transport system permease protein